MAKYIPTFNELPEEQQLQLIEGVVNIINECAEMEEGEAQIHFENKLQEYWSKQKVQDFSELYNTDTYAEFYDDYFGVDSEGIREMLVQLCEDAEEHKENTSFDLMGYNPNMPTGSRDW